MSDGIKFWLDDPKELFIRAYEFWPMPNVSFENNMNRFTRFVIYITIIVAIVLKSFKPLYISVFIIAAIALLYYLCPNQEGMNNVSYNNTNIPSRYDGLGLDRSGYYINTINNSGIGPFNNSGPILQPNNIAGNNPYYGNMLQGVPGVNVAYPNTEPPMRGPMVNNPFMNVPVTAYDAPQLYNGYPRYNATSYPTPSTEKVRSEVNNDFMTGLYQDPNGKLWDRTNSQRQYISQPVGGVPNKQGEFASWLYGRDKVCKTGSIYDKFGVKSTPDSLACTGYEGDGRVTNFGTM